MSRTCTCLAAWSTSRWSAWTSSVDRRPPRRTCRKTPTRLRCSSSTASTTSTCRIVDSTLIRRRATSHSHTLSAYTKRRTSGRRCGSKREDECFWNSVAATSSQRRRTGTGKLWTFATRPRKNASRMYLTIFISLLILLRKCSNKVSTFTVRIRQKLKK